MSGYKEIDERVKALGDCYDKLYKCFCEGALCTECLLGEPYNHCLLNKLQDLIEEIERRKRYELL